MTTDPSAGSGDATDPDGEPSTLASKNPEHADDVVHGIDGVASATPVQDDPEDRDDPDADPDMLGSGS